MPDQQTYQITLHGHAFEVRFDFSRYANNSVPAIRAMHGPMLVTTVTVNLPEEPSEGCVWIKDYSENEGLLDQLVELGLVATTGVCTNSGWVTIPEARLVGAFAAAFTKGASDVSPH